MADPMTLAIAAAAAGKAVEVLGEPAREAVVKLYERVRSRFGRDPEETEALERVAENPESVPRLAALEAILGGAMDADPEFRTEVEALWNQAQQQGRADGGVVNQFSGTAQKVVQLRDVHGNLNL